MHPSSRYPLRGVIVLRVADALRQLGHEVELFELGVTGGFSRYTGARAAVARVIDQTQPDLIHVHFGYGGLAVPNCGLPVVTSFYGDDLNGTVGPNGRITLRSRLGIIVSQWVAWRSSKCITVSAALRSRLWASSTRRKTQVIRDAVDFELFRPIAKTVARERLKLPVDDVLVIFPHDKTQPTKRLSLAERAVDVLRQWKPQARLWVVNGRSPDQMPWYYGAADVLIVTSVREGGPSSVKEALACGLPVVSVPVGDISMFTEARDWILSSEPKPEALAQALNIMIDTRSREARTTRLPAEFSLQNAAREIEAIYRGVAQRGATD